MYKHAIDDLSKPVPVFPLMPVLLYAALRLLSKSGNDVRDSIFVKVTQEAQRLVSLDLFSHLHALSMRFHTNRKTGGVLRAIQRGTVSVNFMIRFLCFNIAPTFLELLFVTLILLVNYKPWYALVTLVTIVGYVVFSLLVTEWRTKYRRVMNTEDNKANNTAVDSLLNFETVKYFNNERHEYRRYNTSLKGYVAAALKAQWSLAFLNIGQTTIISIGTLIVMLLAAREASNDPRSMTVGDFVLVNAYLLQLYTPLSFLGSSYRMIKTSLVDLENMFDLLNQPVEIEDEHDATILKCTEGELEFDDVVFSYDAEHGIALKNIDFKVPAGKMVAIVGHTGAGKSTISRLIFRFYNIESGAVVIDGQDISRVTQTSLRSALGIVPQDSILFNESIFYNIQYGDVEATLEEVKQAAKLAHIHEFIENLPEGYDTIVGERGMRLSGGEKQRVAIARALLKDPKIIVFDEATSSLDTKTEKEIQRSLQEASKGRTTVVIAHRLSTVIDADEILVLSAGEIIERGTHAALLEKEGEYAEMWKQQITTAEESESTSEDSDTGAQDEELLINIHHGH